MKQLLPDQIQFLTKLKSLSDIERIENITTISQEALSLALPHDEGLMEDLRDYFDDIDWDWFESETRTDVGENHFYRTLNLFSGAKIYQAYREKPKKCLYESDDDMALENFLENVEQICPHFVTNL